MKRGRCKWSCSDTLDKGSVLTIRMVNVNSPKMWVPVSYFYEQTGVKKMAWDVYLNGKQIETVFFNDSCDKEYVLRSLIDHDGFPSDICIFRG